MGRNPKTSLGVVKTLNVKCLGMFCLWGINRMHMYGFSMDWLRANWVLLMGGVPSVACLF